MKVTEEIFIEGNLIEKSQVKICYKGKFTKEFSNEVYIVFGYGLGWKNIQEQKMTWIKDAFYADIELVSNGILNFCFRNDFGNWDNNSGNDYTVTVEEEKIVIDEITEEVEILETTVEEKTEDFIENVLEDISENVVEPNTEIIINNSANKRKVNEEIIKKVKHTRRDRRIKKAKNRLNTFFTILIIAVTIYLIVDILQAESVKQETSNLWDKITEKIEVNERIEKVKNLKEEHPNLKAWIEIPETTINYPVMQGIDNDYYVKHDYKDEKSKWGALFVDKDYSWEKPSSNILIYGHNFSDGIMFADLIKYKNKEFYEAHKTIKLTTIDEDAEYEIIAVFNSRVYYQHEENVFRYYFFVDAQNEEEYNEYVENAKKASLYEIEPTAEYGDQLLTLSTCDYIQEDGRFVVVARKIINEENK